MNKYMNIIIVVYLENKIQFCQNVAPPKCGVSGSFPSRWEQTKQRWDQLASRLGSFPRQPLPVLGGSNPKQYDFRRTNRMRRKWGARPRGQRWEMGSAFGSHLVIWLSDR